MARKVSKREAGIRKHFGLANDAEIFFSRKAIPGPNGEKLHGWFCNSQGVTRYLGTSSVSSVESKLDNKTVMPPPRIV